MNKSANGSGEPASILVVDDEQAIRRALKLSLGRAGYNVNTVASGEEAVEYANAGNLADIIISDYKLMGINGIETILTCKKQLTDVGSILITGFGTDETIIDAFSRGRVDYYLNKPFEMHEINKVVSIVLKEVTVRRKERVFKDKLQKMVQEATKELQEKNSLLEQKEKETAKLNKRLHEEQERLKNVNLRLEELSITDGLTGLFNYRHFKNRLENEFRRVERYSGKLSLLMLDIDNFKMVNDEHGHLAGDRALIQIGKVLLKSSRQIDLVARYGGEEFALLLPAVGLPGAALHAERLRESIGKLSVEYGDIVIKMKVSIGIASYGNGFKNPVEFVKAADEALYHAKRTGKDRVIINRGEGILDAVSDADLEAAKNE